MPLLNFCRRFLFPLPSSYLPLPVSLFPLLTSLFLFSSSLLSQSFYNPLFVPPAIVNDTFNLNMQTGTMQFYPSVTTPTYGFNGNYLGPTLIMNMNDSVWINVTNSLVDTSTVHWHGLHISSLNDGGPHVMIDPMMTWSIKFKLRNPASTCWYHPHLHQLTGTQVYRGLAGVIIVKDPVETALTLPRTYGVDDFPLVLQDRSFDAFGNFTMEALSDSMLVNGTAHAKLDVPSQVVRFRFVNGSGVRAYNLGFSDNRNFFVIASDGGLLTSPFSTNRIKISGGERYEILVDLTNDQGDSLLLMSYGSTLANNEPGGGGPFNGSSPLNQVDFPIMQLNVGVVTSNPVTTIPVSLITLNPLNPSNANRTRPMNISGMGMFDMGNFSINGNIFDLTIINDTVRLDDIEIWKIKNISNIAHPFHIHDINFYTLKRNGVTPPPWEQGLKDTWYLKQNDSIEIIGKFTNFTNDTIPYMYHCHNLSHEDNGMMGSFIVINAPVGINDFQNTPEDFIYPNPCAEILNIQKEKIKGEKIKIFNLLGELVLEPGNSKNIDISSLPSGIYFLVMTGEAYRFVKE
jgi:FtsP/CotA-like multicopper oxidase with cupredoxin domain